MREKGALAVEALHRQVLPFILRRVKEQVLKDLPPKIIQDVYCDLSPLQTQLYEEYSLKQKLVESEDNEGGEEDGNFNGKCNCNTVAHSVSITQHQSTSTQICAECYRTPSRCDSEAYPSLYKFVLAIVSGHQVGKV